MDVATGKEEGDAGRFAMADEMFTRAWRNALPDLRRRALRLANGRLDAAEDLLSDTAVKALLFMRRSPEAMTDPQGFLFVVLRHVFLDAVRRRRGGEPLDRQHEAHDVDTVADQGMTALQRAELSDQMERVVAAVAALTREQRRLFGYRFVEELPYPVIANLLSINQPLVRKRVELLRKRLRLALVAE
ncbi:sigma-70 family RNA polymerase sigma factor [Xanthomonas bonasiae]|jgi:RNA polymerase sigma-70 factor (ECF subfamily)|uniref:sigma-70 family RNA polymerase sigma factor n=1 Tax=Xanthomonas bonasiae TaxID=2810351 RepID=UPI00197DCE13|nr:sigma-70 family RNA polymerase sigma factor [Xanthomonas bonasiae]MBN6114035.1 sigma-70 family RNA polymerase sigma factor [Xanthomonas bonasiae]